MMPAPSLDAIVVGAGPNGLTAAVTLARAGLSVRVYEAADEAGGGVRTEELTLPGYRHDVCSAVHPHGVGSPALRTLPLAEHGLEWIEPDIPMAHPLADGRAAVLAHSVAHPAASLGADGPAYERPVRPFPRRVATLDELPPARAYLLDVLPGALLDIAGDRLPARYASRLRCYRAGPAVFKVDYALSEPVPWTAEACRRAGTVHVGASYEEIDE